MKEKILRIGIFFTIMILTILGIYQVSKYEVISTQAKDTEPKALTTVSPGTLAQGEKNPNNYNYHINAGSQWEALQFTSSFIPMYQDFEIYCIQPGSRVLNIYQIRYANALAMVGHQYLSNCGHASTPREGDRTPPVYRPEGSAKKLPVAVAYIVSDEPIGAWSTEKQKAIDNLRYSTIYDAKTNTYKRADEGLVMGSEASGRPELQGSSIYDKEAVDYGTYDYSVRDTGLKPTDKTDLNSVYTKINQKTEEYTVGPFNIEYTNGTFGNISFSGISEMTVVGYNSKGKQVRDDIKIEKIILKDKATGIYGKAQAPQYFEPSANLKVDETKQVYPVSGQDFQIVFKDPNKGLSENNPNRVASISVKVKFKYMLANGEYMKYKGTKYIVSYSHNESYNPHTHTVCTSACHTVRSSWTDSEGKKHTSSYRCHHDRTYKCHGCITTCYLDEWAQQYIMTADAIRSIYEQEIIIGFDKVAIDTTMDLGGHVWEDVPSGKESIADGQSTILQGQNGDRAIPNVKVTLYTEDGEIANLLSNSEEQGITDNQIMHRVNPTYTDSEGNYLFEGLNPMKKYYVTFEYNGQIYLPTEYLNTGSSQYSSVTQMVNAELYNTNEWKVTSKGTEYANDRNDYNEQFAEIGSAPTNYKSSNSLHSGELVNGYNESFSQYELMGFVLDENGNYYRDDSRALIDGFYKIENGNIVETDTAQEGIISKKIQEYIIDNKKAPDDNAMLEIYEDIAGNNSELWKKLQFIEDCKMESYTKPQNGQLDLYPVYDQFRINHAINNAVYTTASQAQNGNYDMNVEVLDGVTYRPIYPGQFFVNQGLWRRQEVDLALRKDVAFAATRINGKTEVYKYDKRTQMTDAEAAELARLREIYEQDRTNTANYEAYINYAQEIQDKYYWEIQLRMRDYNNYYATAYSRELYPADYTYRATMNGVSANNELELYVTYKITLRNSSTSILSEITEVVDYYDEDYEYMEDLSWVMYKTNSNGSNSEISLSEEDYYRTIHELSLQGDLRNTGKEINSHNSSRYGSASQQSGMESEYNSVYIRGLDSKKLASGEEAYIYLTFKVRSDSRGPVILDEDNSLKENFAEINGYTTYYRDGTELPNKQTMNSNNVAGIIDIDSTPGNLERSDISGNKYEKNFEDDTDRAKSIKVTLDNEAIRSINGTVWEDERTQNVSNAIIGDGLRDDEIGIAGVTVELVEKLENGSEHVWQTTTTDKNGRYEFRTNESGNVYIIPGNYIIRFKYGNTEATVLTEKNGGSNEVSYNGQDFKSTVYQQNLNNNSGISNYTEEYYNIQASDAFNGNLSDAKDIWEKRQEVNSYSSSNVTNHIAEVLTAPYANEINDGLIDELIENTNMTAETAIIVLEGEYNRTNTDGYNTASNGSDIYLYENDYNGNYTLNNVDFGLTERPKAQLELSKKIANIKVTLANGNTLIDSNRGATSLNDTTWLESKDYNVADEMKNNKYNEYYNSNHRYAYRTEIDKLVASKYDASHNNGLIKIDLDNELMHGATITINYEITIKNASERDFEGQEFYYKARGANQVVTTTANSVVDYVANNLQFRAEDNNEDGWKTVGNVVEEEELAEQLAKPIESFNTVIKTENLNKALTPGETTTANLILTQLMTAQNTADNRTYNNIAEITTISNSVGRRMAYSIQGNQDPTADEPSEVDSARPEEVTVLPPTGIGEIVVYVTVAIATLGVLIVGIIVIKRKVLKK